VGISEGGRCIFLFGELCVCVGVCGGDVLSDFRPLGDGKDVVRVTHCLLSELNSSEQFVPKQI
jgi:hypothetical protein